MEKVIYKRKLKEMNPVEQYKVAILRIISQHLPNDKIIGIMYTKDGSVIVVTENYEDALFYVSFLSQGYNFKKIKVIGDYETKQEAIEVAQKVYLIKNKNIEFDRDLEIDKTY